MEINKTYDITELGNKVQEAIESCVAGKSNRCSIDLLTASEILEVLRETYKREQKHQTLGSALTFIENEDGTQTNEMEMHNKDEMPDCYSKITGSYEICERCGHNKSCVYRVRKKAEDKIIQIEHSGCFGHFDGNEIECCICDDMKWCEEETKQRRSKTNE